MEKMKELLFLTIPLAFLNAIHGQVNIPESTAAALGDDVSLECTTTVDNPTFSWIDDTTGFTIYIGDNRARDIPQYANIVLQEGTDAQTSILNINGIEIEDEGGYRCELNSQTTPSDATMVTVEVGSQTSQEIILSSIDGDTRYRATYDAIESKPAETITWILDGVEQTDGIVVTDLGATLPQYSTRSTFTFPATLENYEVLLECNISGHQVSKLNRQKSKRVDIHSLPQSGSIRNKIDAKDSTLVVTCEMTEEAQPTPAITNFYIYSNDTLIPKSTDSVNTVTVEKPEQATNFSCEAGNYLGNTTATELYDPDGTTNPPTPTAPAPAETTSPETNDAGRNAGTKVNAGAIAGGVVGGVALVVIILLVIKFVVKPDWMGGSGSSGGGPRKPTSSAVGSSNGNEKEKIKPSAAPRTASSIQHTTDNPDQAEYAMVDRKPAGGKGKGGGGDMPDTRGGYGAGQNEQGMVYADLDLSSKAGHTERQVPKDTDNVVVYSSILV